MKRLFILTALFSACMLTTCGVQTTQGGDGGATETVNAQVIISDSTVAVNISSKIEILADVIIFDKDYNPVTKYGFCDSAKAIPADSLVTFGKLTGKYNVIIINRIDDNSLAFTSISAGAPITDTIIDTLSPSGSIRGNVIYNSSSNAMKTAHLVYLKGTPYFTETDSSCSFKIEAIPSGKYFIEATMSGPDKYTKSNRTVGKEVEIKSSMNTDSITLFFSE